MERKKSNPSNLCRAAVILFAVCLFAPAPARSDLGGIVGPHGPLDDRWAQNPSYASPAPEDLENLCLSLMPTGGYETLTARLQNNERLVIGRVTQPEGNGSADPRGAFLIRVDLDLSPKFSKKSGSSDFIFTMTTLTDFDGCYAFVYNADQHKTGKVEVFAESRDAYADSEAYVLGAAAFGSLASSGSNWRVETSAGKGNAIPSASTEDAGVARSMQPYLHPDVLVVNFDLNDGNVTARELNAFQGVRTALEMFWWLTDVDNGAARDFPKLTVRVSEAIDTEYYDPGLSKVYIDRDTDRGVIAHEVCHYFQDVFYTGRDRDHLVKRVGDYENSYTTDKTDARMSFFEGVCNAFAGIYGPAASMPVPRQDPGIWSIENVAYLFYKLFTSASPDQIRAFHQIYESDEFENLPVFQTMHSFAYLYNRDHGPDGDFDGWMEEIGVPDDSYKTDIYDSGNAVGGAFGHDHALYPSLGYLRWQYQHAGGPIFEGLPEAEERVTYGPYWYFDSTDGEDVCYLLRRSEGDFPEIEYRRVCDNISEMAAENDPENYINSIAVTEPYFTADYDAYEYAKLIWDADLLDPQVGQFRSRWFVFDTANLSNMELHGVGELEYAYLEGFEGYYTEPTSGYAGLKIASDDSDCTARIGVEVYQNGQSIYKTEGPCPEIPESGLGNGVVLIEVYQPDGGADLTCFGFMQSDFCELAAKAYADGL